MSLQWADFPTGQQGLYNDISELLDGTPWVATALSVLVTDPDGVSGGLVLRHSSSSTGPESATRLAVSSPNQKMGAAFRLYVTSLPTSTRSFFTFNTTGNSAQYGLRLQANGGMEIVRGTTTVIATQDSPIITANAWRHIEFVADVVTGELEVRIEGVTIANLTLTDGSPPGGTIGLVGFPDRNPGQGSFNNFHCKDLVVYNGAGSVFNDFQGSVIVEDIVPDSDITIPTGWTLSTGTDAYALIDEEPLDDADYISADSTPPSPAEFTFTNLNPDVVSVRGLLSIVRATKTDGGDGNLQISLSPDGTNYDTGADTPITTTFTFSYDVSELSPATGVAWTPTEVNSLEARVDRTI